MIEARREGGCWDESVAVYVWQRSLFTLCTRQSKVYCISYLNKLPLKTRSTSKNTTCPFRLFWVFLWLEKTEINIHHPEILHLSDIIRPTTCNSDSTFFLSLITMYFIVLGPYIFHFTFLPVYPDLIWRSWPLSYSIFFFLCRQLPFVDSVHTFNHTLQKQLQQKEEKDFMSLPSDFFYNFKLN